MAIAGPARTTPISDLDPRNRFAGLYREHRESTLRLLYRITGSWSAAEDALHQAFATLYARRADIDLTKPFRNLLITVALNFARREHRDRQRLPRPEASASGRDSRPAQVEELVRVLSADERTIVVLRYYERFSFAEIAEFLALPVGTVKWKMHEAIARLRTGLEKLADEL